MPSEGQISFLKTITHIAQDDGLALPGEPHSTRKSQTPASAYLRSSSAESGAGGRWPAGIQDSWSRGRGWRYEIGLRKTSKVMRLPVAGAFLWLLQ